jgi:hypothetical protein
VGIEPTPPHWMYGALLSFVREGHTKHLNGRQLLAHQPSGTSLLASGWRTGKIKSWYADPSAASPSTFKPW